MKEIVGMQISPQKSNVSNGCDGVINLRYVD